MATSSSDETLEFWLGRAINVLAKEEDWEAIVGFCDRVNKDSDGPQNAVRLLTHKIQSPQEKESMLALTVLEACVKNCGRRFQQEIGKFRFLNEIIKLLSPKFMGNYTSVKVKQKCTELLYYWTEVLEYEPKIKEAYQMLRRQGIIKEDPVIKDWNAEVDSPPPQPPPPPPPTSRNSIFEDEDKSKLLSRLLRSKNPDDLMAANRLIKNMVKQDAERSEKVSMRINELDIVYNNVKLLGDMLQNYQPGGATQSDKEIMKELYDNLENHRPKLFRLASDADESDESGIADILKANDEVIRVMALYEDLVNKADVVNLLDTEGAGPSASSLSDLQTLTTATVQTSVVVSTTSSSDLLCENPPSISILDDQLQKLGLGSASLSNGFQTRTTNSSERDDLAGLFSTSDSRVSHPSMDLSSSAFTASSFPSTAVPLQPFNSNVNAQPTTFNVLQPVSNSFPPVTTNTAIPAMQAMYRSPVVPVVQSTFPPSTVSLGTLRPIYQSPMPVLPIQQPMLLQSTFASPVRTATSLPMSAGGEAGVAPKTSSGLHSLDAIGRSALMDSLATTATTMDWSSHQSSNVQSKVPMNQMSKVSMVPSSTASNLSPSIASSSVTAADNTSGDILPLNDVFVPLDSIKPGGMHPVVAYDKNGIKIMFHFGKDRPRLDVLVIAVSIMNSNASPVKGFVFQAAVPKVMKIKLQPASATDLPAFNPILPLSAITQVMLIAHRPQDKVLLRFKITYSIRDALTTDVGEVQFSSSDTLL